MAFFTIQLHQLRFFAPHGLFDEERAAGNEFEVNLTLEIEAPENRLVSLEESINYATVFELVKHVFEKQERLLENLAIEIADAIKKEFPALKEIAVQVVKLYPPITSFAGSVSVTYCKKYEN